VLRPYDVKAAMSWPHDWPGVSPHAFGSATWFADTTSSHTKFNVVRVPEIATEKAHPLRCNMKKEKWPARPARKVELD
jgi:hypothetical protein